MNGRCPRKKISQAFYKQEVFWRCSAGQDSNIDESREPWRDERAYSRTMYSDCSVEMRFWNLALNRIEDLEFSTASASKKPVVVVVAFIVVGVVDAIYMCSFIASAPLYLAVLT